MYNKRIQQNKQQVQECMQITLYIMDAKEFKHVHLVIYPGRTVNSESLV